MTDTNARMERLVRSVAGQVGMTYGGGSFMIPTILIKEARAIVAELPEPVDPDLIEAREMVADHWQGEGYWHIAQEYRAGERDKALDFTLAAIKRGRELQRGEG